MTNRQRRSAKAKEAGRAFGVKLQKPKGEGDGSWQAFYAKKKANGQCMHCSNLATTTPTLCLKCWFANVSSVHFGTRKLTSALQDLFNSQSGLCAYTGETLIPGKNASLDHTIALTRGGVPSIGNVRWVSKKINMMKQDMTDHEFFETCHRILEFAG